MNKMDKFQTVCANCGNLSVKIENPISAPSEAIVECGNCGISRGTIGSLRRLATGANLKELPTIGMTADIQSGKELASLYKTLKTLERNPN